MKIEDVGIAEYGVPLVAGDARRMWTERRGLLVTLRDEDGRIGQGEASPLVGYSHETLEDCRSALLRLGWRGLGLDAAALPVALAGAFDRRGLPPAAIFALETALLDLLGQRLDRSIADLLSAGRREAPIAALVGSGSEALAQAGSAVSRGVRALKFKVGRDLSADLATLRAVRHELGDVELRLDANGAWDAPAARANLAALAEVSPSYVEDPVAPERWSELGPVPVPLAVDEALGSEYEGGALAAHGVRVVVLKPSRLGGFLACLDHAERGGRMGFDVVLGHMYEGPVAMAAIAELALAVPRPVRACGLDRHAALDAWDVAPPQIEPDRIVSVGPGLGLPVLRVPGARSDVTRALR